MWGTMTTFSQWSRPGVILGSSSYTSRPHLCGNACNMRAASAAVQGPLQRVLSMQSLEKDSSNKAAWSQQAYALTPGMQGLIDVGKGKINRRYSGKNCGSRRTGSSHWPGGSW